MEFSSIVCLEKSESFPDFKLFRFFNSEGLNIGICNAKMNDACCVTTALQPRKGGVGLSHHDCHPEKKIYWSLNHSFFPHQPHTAATALVGGDGMVEEAIPDVTIP